MKKKNAMALAIITVAGIIGIAFAAPGHHAPNVQKQEGHHMMNMDGNKHEMAECGDMMGMHTEGMMQDMKYSMSLHMYLGLHEDFHSEMSKINTDTHSKTEKLIKQIADNRKVLDDLFKQDNPDQKKILKLIQDNETAHSTIMGIHLEAKKQKMALMEKHHQDVNKKTSDWLKKAEKDKTELEKYIKYVKTHSSENGHSMHGNSMDDMGHHK